MGNLMNETSKMDALYSKYQGFLVPSVKILIGESGKDLAGNLNGQIGELTVSLSLDTAASATFSVVNGYDYKNHSFQDSLIKELCLGNSLKVELGYGSNLERVFSGFIYSVKAEFQETAVLSVTALDVRRIMEDSVRTNLIWKYTTYSEVFKQVMEPYKKLYSKLVVDKTSDNAVESVMQNESDLAFVKRLATEGNREFFVFDDVVYFRRKAKRNASVTLTWGQDLISFSKESIYADQQVTVQGLLKDSKNSVNATVEVKTSENIKQVVTGGAVRTINSPSSDTQDKAAQKAAKKAEELRQKKQSGQGTCVGLVQLIPGRPVAIAGLASQINGDYMLKSVTHTFGSEGFQTSFVIGGFNG